MQSIADAINDDLKVLELDGIEVEGITGKLHGALAYICGDNLGCHSIGGFNCSFGPNVYRPCRFCLTTNTELQEVLETRLVEQRTVQNYNAQVEIIMLNANEMRTYGIRKKSHFNHLSYHVVDGLPPDIMHDLLEGVVPFEIQLVLKSLIGKGFFDLDLVNRTLHSWKYGPLDKRNQPVALTEEKVRRNAARSWCLLRLLPIMIGSYVPENDAHWLFLIELKDIVEICFSYKLSESHISYFRLKIQDHLCSFLDLFPNTKLLPKHHFLLHYPDAIQKFGPLRLCWSMRFESKHSYFKQIVPVVKNFKNLNVTLATRHQLHQAYYFACESSLTLDDIQ